MKLWFGKIVFTGDKPFKNKKRPPDTTLIISHNKFDGACELVAQYAKRRWPNWRFEIEQVSDSKILSRKPLRFITTSSSTSKQGSVKDEKMG